MARPSAALVHPAAFALATAVALTVASPRAARAGSLGPDAFVLEVPRSTPAAGALSATPFAARTFGALAAGEKKGADEKGAGEKKGAGEGKGSMDFDLLGEAKPPPETADASSLRLRRRMLGVHQGIGLGLVGLQLATTAVGQLNYSDRYGGGPDTARYKLSHQALAYTTLGTFVVNGAIALLAPSAHAPRKMDRVMVHRIAMFTAAAGMAAQAILGVQTRNHIGLLDQERIAKRHLVIGYATTAAVAVGFGVLVF